MIIILNSKDYPKKENKFAMNFVGTSNFTNILNKMFPDCTIYLKSSYPDEGRIYFNSWRAREFVCNIIPERFFMCFASYDGETMPPFVGNLGVMEWKDGKRITPRSFDKRRLKNE